MSESIFEPIFWMLLGAVITILVLVLIGTVREHRELNQKGWCDRRDRRIYAELPDPDLTEAEASHFVAHLRFYGLPGRRNSAIVRYLTGKHDAAEMEHRLNERLGLGPQTTYGGYVRGQVIADYERGLEQRRRRAT